MVAAHHFRHVHERGFGIAEAAVVGHTLLRQVNLERGKESGENTNQHGREQDVAPGVLDFLGQYADAVKPDVGSRGEGGAGGNGSHAERSRIVKRVGGNQSLPVLVRKQYTRAPQQRKASITTDMNASRI